MRQLKSNTYKSMMPLINILKIFCLNCNIDEEKMNSKYILAKSLIMVAIIGCLNFFGFYYKINYIYKYLDLSVKITDIVQIIFDFLQYLFDIYFVCKCGRHICVIYFKQYESIDSRLGVINFNLLKSKLLKLMAIFFIIWAISSALDFGAWLHGYGWITPISHSMAYCFVFLKMLTILDLMAHVIHMEERLRLVGNSVQDCYMVTDTGQDNNVADFATSNKWLCKQNNTDSQIIKRNGNGFNEVKSLTSCYLLLTEQVSFINEIYGIRILLNNVSLLSDMIKVTNLAVRIIIITQQQLNVSNYIRVVSSLFRLITCATVFVMMVNQCEKVYRQRERILNIIDNLLINKNPDVEFRVAVVNFRQLIQDRPIIFNMANFVSLNYSLLVSLTSAFVTYTIILLQSVN